jgi:7-dehydrocholesterol reductase
VRTETDAGIVRTTLGPAALMLTTPFVATLMWVAVDRYHGSVLEMAQAGPGAWIAALPMPTGTAALIVIGWVAFQALLLRFLPGERFLGPVTPAGVQPEYKLNGMAAWLVTHGLIFGVLWPAGLLDPGALLRHYGSVLALLTISALAFCVFLYWKGMRYPTSPDTVYTGNLLFDFFQGIDLHPRLLGMNLKQLVNCRVSMMGWSVVFGCCAVAQLERHGAVSTSMLASVAVLGVYLFKFFWWEGGYFHSLDIMHDRFGYYICWGVLAWVPSMYCIPALWLVDHPIQLPVPVALAIVALGLVSIWINYDADAQRQRVRRTSGNTTVWGKPPETMVARYVTADGQHRTSLLLLSGWWGVARHFHYVPELALAAAWTVPAGFTHALPWAYWVFLFILLMDRSVRDEKRCAKKYGEDWSVYCRRVPYRVLPGVF